MSNTMQLQYKIETEDGQIVASSQEKFIEYTVGESDIEGFEDKLSGLQPGQECTWQIEPEFGFGEYAEENIITINRDQFPEHIPVKEKQIVSFSADDTSEEIAGMISDYNEYFVMVDFNHPLAGKKLTAWAKRAS